MLKFKMSLFLKSAKFRVAIAAFIIATIISGIVLVSGNKASNLSNQVTVVANKSGVTANGKKYFTVKKSGNATGYDVLFCIEQDASLSSKTYSNPISITKASKYFSSYNSAMWLINNMYTTNTTGQNGLANETAKNVMAQNLANLLTSETVKSAVAKKGLNTSGITPQKIYNLRNKTLNSTSNENALQFVEQVALWKYTNNVGNTFTNAYAENVNQYLEGTSLTSDEQLTLKYTLYALRTLADMNNSKSSSTSVSNYVTLNKNNAKYDVGTSKVGPYYLESNGIRLTSYSFGAQSNAAYPVSLTITKGDGKTVTAGAELIQKNNDGSFYINLANHKDAKKVDLKIDYILSTISTDAYVLDGGDKQDLLTVQKSVGAASLTDSKTITNAGKYKVILLKVDKKGTLLNSSPAKFKINGKEQSTENGLINIVENKTIANASQTDTYEITETQAPNGYIAAKGTAKLTVKFKQSGNTFVVDESKTTISGMKEAKVSVDVKNTTVIVSVENEPKEGTFNVVLKKVMEDGTTVITSSEATFKIGDKEQKTKNGILSIAQGETIASEKQNPVYKIQETKAPQGYEAISGTATLSVKFKTQGTSYVVDKDKTTLQGTDGMKAAKLEVSSDNSTITIYVPNTKKEFDLSLRKFISSINGKKVEPSREPVINEESIKILQQTGTAAYYHTKDSISVKVGDEVEYTIRVYNEGKVLGFAKQITDYLPDGLSFVKLADDNSKEYSTKTEAGSKVVVIDYNGNTELKTLRDFFGKKDFNVTSDYYQEVKLICKVLDTDKTYITNRGEITNYGYSEKDADGNVVWKDAVEVGNTDRDSAQNTIKDNLGLDTWYENAKEYTYKDENGKDVVVENYYPGTQDDDDFETVELLKGEYNVIIKKVDSSDSKQTLKGAYFSVKGSKLGKEVEVGPTGSNGEVTLLKGVKINSDEEIDEYTIKETKAPLNYNLYENDIVLKIGTKLTDGVFTIDDKNININQKDIKYTVNENGTSITIVIPDVKKEFDLSLRKFITEVNGEELAESREPQVDVSKLISGESKTATYTHPKDPVSVNTTDIVTYTIRVYNEGEMDGYASKVMDDIPEGLEFVPAEFDKEGKPTNINAEYKWVAYREMASDEVAIPESVIKYNDKLYVITDNVKEADLIVTDYLSKENGTDNLIKGFNPNTMKELNYKDIKVSFKVTEPTTSDRILTNHAQITDDTDSEGNPTDDRDSTPNQWNEGEDDQDTEPVKVNYFDLALRKWVTKAIVYENGNETVTETNHTPYDDPEEVVKVDLKNTSINNVEVKFEYSIRVINEGEIAGYAKEISDYIPAGLKFVAADNPQWTEVDGKIVTTALENTLLQPGEYADVTVLLTWINGEDNLGLKTNVAEISKDYNDYGTPDIDSTPNNQVQGEDDIDDAPVILTIRTGKPIVYTGVAIAVLAILSTGAVIIKRKILE